jgi:hypothetical protein
MSLPSRLRGIFGRYLPSWLSDNFPSLPSYGYRLLFICATFVDSEIDRMLQGSLAKDGRGSPTALKYIGQARGVVRGRYDTDEEFFAKLRTWIDRNKERGQQRRLAREIWEYLGDDGSGASRVRVVNRAGWWVTIDEAGDLTETQADWDWDSVSHPERSDVDEPWWSDLWIVIYPSWTFRAGDLGDLTGADGFAIGHMAPDVEIDALKILFREWKAAHECIRCVIWTTDDTLFDPDDPMTCPDGTWGGWGGTGSGSRVASGRDYTNCRFWEPGSRDREVTS